MSADDYSEVKMIMNLTKTETLLAKVYMTIGENLTYYAGWEFAGRPISRINHHTKKFFSMSPIMAGLVYQHHLFVCKTSCCQLSRECPTILRRCRIPSHNGKSVRGKIGFPIGAEDASLTLLYICVYCVYTTGVRISEMNVCKSNGPLTLMVLVPSYYLFKHFTCKDTSWPS